MAVYSTRANVNQDPLMALTECAGIVSHLNAFGLSITSITLVSGRFEVTTPNGRNLSAEQETHLLAITERTR